MKSYYKILTLMLGLWAPIQGWAAYPYLTDADNIRTNTVNLRARLGAQLETHVNTARINSICSYLGVTAQNVAGTFDTNDSATIYGTILGLIDKIGDTPTSVKAGIETVLIGLDGITTLTGLRSAYDTAKAALENADAVYTATDVANTFLGTDHGLTLNTDDIDLVQDDLITNQIGFSKTVDVYKEVDLTADWGSAPAFTGTTITTSKQALYHLREIIGGTSISTTAPLALLRTVGDLAGGTDTSIYARLNTLSTEVGGANDNLYENITDIKNSLGGSGTTLNSRVSDILVTIGGTSDTVASAITDISTQLGSTGVNIIAQIDSIKTSIGGNPANVGAGITAVSTSLGGTGTTLTEQTADIQTLVGTGPNIHTGLTDSLSGLTEITNVLGLRQAYDDAIANPGGGGGGGDTNLSDVATRFLGADYVGDTSSLNAIHSVLQDTLLGLGASYALADEANNWATSPNTDSELLTAKQSLEFLKQVIGAPEGTDLSTKTVWELCQGLASILGGTSGSLYARAYASLSIMADQTLPTPPA